jgi:hypothetical protein
MLDKWYESRFDLRDAWLRLYSVGRITPIIPECDFQKRPSDIATCGIVSG